MVEDAREDTFPGDSTADAAVLIVASFVVLVVTFLLPSASAMFAKLNALTSKNLGTNKTHTVIQY